MVSGATGYVVRLVGAEVGGVVRLALAEIVERGGFVPAPSARSWSHKVGGVRLLFEEGTADEKQLEGIVGQLSAGVAGPTWAGKTFVAGRLVRRAPVILPVASSMRDDDEARHLHPDGRYTYHVEEWWDAEEGTLDALWNTRHFREIGEAVQSEIGVPLHYASARIGNLRVLRRLSGWYLDDKHDHLRNSRWYRPLRDAGTPDADLRLHVRFLSAADVVQQVLARIDESGAEFPVRQDYSAISASLFDAQTGKLLAHEYGDLFGRPRIRIGPLSEQTVVDSKGKSHVVAWTLLDSSSTGIDLRSPWNDRAGRAQGRNAILAEASTVRLHEKGERAEAVDSVRRILQEQDSVFLYIWDPYLDDKVVLDFLPWLHPNVPCRLLCGQPSDKHPIKDPRVKALQKAVAQVRTANKKTMGGKYRVRPLTKKRFGAIYHDRFIVTAQGAWVLGQSLNGLGNKPGAMIRVLDTDRVRWMFDDEWARTDVSVVEVPL